MVDMVYFLVCLFMICAISFGAGIEFAAFLYKKRKEVIKNDNV